jgi:hypothetical protein
MPEVSADLALVTAADRPAPEPGTDAAERD